MKIIFDSNIWQIICIPDNYLDDPLIDGFRIIRQAILDNKVEAYLSETIFTIEAIRKIERQDFFSLAEANIESKQEVVNNSVVINFTIGPNEKDAIDFNERPILEKYFNEAVKLGFRIVSLSRIGGLVNPDVEKVRFKLSGDDFMAYHDLACEVAREIESKNAGMEHIKKLGKSFNNGSWFNGLKKAPESDRKKVAKAAAEWADGDSVAISVGLKCDFFCTRDKAKGAGSRSVLSQSNLMWLETKYNFLSISPDELVIKLKNT